MDQQGRAGREPQKYRLGAHSITHSQQQSPERIQEMKLNFLKNGNWGLKLLALILALIIYHTLKPAAKTSNSQFRINLPHDEQKPQ